MKGTNNSLWVRKLVGERLRKAREEKGYDRPTLADKLGASDKAPTMSLKNDKGDDEVCNQELTVERYKQWEYGKNPVALEWIPAICDVLSCDVGYLFGEYDELTRCASDICSATNLSEKAVSSLLEMKGSADNCPSGSLAVGAHRLQALNLLLETKEGARFFEIAYAFLFGQYDLVNVYSPDVSNECENTYARLIDSTGHADSVSVQAGDMTAMFVLHMQNALMELKSKIQGEKSGQ
jgi:transcriptional regulator with XRE-family HTH domain